MDESDYSSLDFEQYKLKKVQLTDKKLGHGSYATVIEVNYMGLKCAGKILHEVLLEQGKNTYSVQRFQEECRILGRIRHPNIVQFLGVYFKEKDYLPVLVMEFLPMTLTSCIEDQGILPMESTCSILNDLALGLCYLHSQEPPIIHRDLSANNVLLTHHLQAKISDLGVAKMLNLTPLQVSRMSQAPGTPAYMPPEVMIANPIYDTSIDEFSFGILIIHMLSGRWPEPECSQIRMEAGMMIPMSEADRRQSLLKAIGKDHPLMSLLLQCIHNDPKQRPPATDILEQISNIKTQIPQPEAEHEDKSGEKCSNEKSQDEQQIKTDYVHNSPSTIPVTHPENTEDPNSTSPNKTAASDSASQLHNEATLTEAEDTNATSKLKTVETKAASDSASQLHNEATLTETEDTTATSKLKTVETKAASDSASQLHNEATLTEVEDTTATSKLKTVETKVASDGVSQLHNEATLTEAETTTATSKLKTVETKKKKRATSFAVVTERKDKEQSTQAPALLGEWYFGNLERILALSKCKENGDFLVRYSTGKQQYIITCRWKDTCQHYIVDQNSSGKYLVGSKCYDSVRDLIDFYVTSGQQLTSAGEILMKAVSRRDNWSMNCTDLRMMKKIGSSEHFGEICEALDKRNNEMVIAKSYDGISHDSINKFLLEAEVLKRCNHQNVVRLIGVCLDPNRAAVCNPVYIITEYTPGGILLQLLKKEGKTLTKKELCKMSTDVCKGLQYIHTRLHLAHCDIAVRSCLVGENKVVKLSNFGRAMNFNNTSECKLLPDKVNEPIRWSAPEIFNQKRWLLSDVWSYGILVWEIFTAGKQPYSGMKNNTVLDKVLDGYHMDPSQDGCPQEISIILLECWKYDPKERPKLSEVLLKLQDAYEKL